VNTVYGVSRLLPPVLSARVRHRAAANLGLQPHFFERAIMYSERQKQILVEITRGLGEGLDTQALAAVAGWRFEPAKKNGQPVAVLINVQVTFRLQ